MSELSTKKCVPCQGGLPPLKGEAIRGLLDQLEGWQVEHEQRLKRSFDFPDFAHALAFVNRLGAIAEEEAHHPDIHLAWGKVGVEIWTHKIGGLTESDFILAAKYDHAFAHPG